MAVAHEGLASLAVDLHEVGDLLALTTLLEKPLLMAHLVWLLVAHPWCAINSTPLVIFTNGAPPGAPLVSGILMAHHLVRH